MFAFCKILFWCGFVPKLLSTAFSRWSPCGSGSVCHLHIPRSHQQSPGHFSTLQMQSSDFSGNRSTWGKVFLSSAFLTSQELTEKNLNLNSSTLLFANFGNSDPEISSQSDHSIRISLLFILGGRNAFIYESIWGTKSLFWRATPNLRCHVIIWI